MAYIYRNVLPKEVIESLKASEISEMRKIEDSLTNNYVSLIIIGFVWAVFLIAFLLWMNKFTLFFLLVLSLVLIPFTAGVYFSHQKYLKTLKAVVSERGVKHDN